MSDQSAPELTPEAKAAGHDLAKGTEPSLETLKEGVVDANG